MTDDDLVRALVRRTTSLVVAGTLHARAGDRTFFDFFVATLPARCLLGAIDKKIMDEYERGRAAKRP